VYRIREIWRCKNTARSARELEEKGKAGDVSVEVEEKGKAGGGSVEVEEQRVGR
jgi:hypothetical protein